MLISRKISFLVLGSILFIAGINIISFYVFYDRFVTIYIADTRQSKESITRDYIDSIIEQQALDDIDAIFDNVEIKFLELLEKGDGTIPLDSKENVDLVVDYLSKAGVSPKYIEQVIPQNYLEKILYDLQDDKSPEYRFFHNFIFATIITNAIAITFLLISLYILANRILKPIERTTKRIKNLKIGKDFQKIYYDKNDEIGLLVSAINDLNVKLNIGENIKNKLLADISHELKTPITAIQLYLEGIQDGVIQLDDKVLNSIISEMERLIKMVNAIMDFEKSQHKPASLHLEKINVYTLTQDIISQYTQTLKNTHQKIQVLGLKKKILCDKNSYIQILQNIISNFLKYAGKNTTLSIYFATNYIRFADNGIGIPKTELPYIKEKFYQGKQGKVGNIEDRGIGVGLSIIEKLVKQHNWTLEISSQENSGFEIKIITQTSQ